MYKTCLNNYLKITKEIRIKKKYLIIHNLHISLILHFVEGNSLRAKNYFKQVGLPICSIKILKINETFLVICARV